MLTHLPNPVRSTVTVDTGARDVYFGLLDDPARSMDKAREWLQHQLAAACTLPAALPEDADLLSNGSGRRVGDVDHAFQSYLRERDQGAPRRLFPDRDAARWFLRACAPTALVSGAWLYGMLPHYGDRAHVPFIRMYLDNLGHGDPDRCHAAIYRRLLQKLGCDHLEGLDESYFVQGAIQLCLGYHLPTFLPEVLGYHLGREQGTLQRRLIGHELAELDIDPHYFSLNGRLEQPLRPIRGLLLRTGDRQAFLRRMRDGFKLNARGAQSLSILAALDPVEGSGCRTDRHPRSRFAAAESDEGIQDVEQIAAMPVRAEAMSRLFALMSPARQHTRVGLMATKLYSRMLAG